MEIKKGDIVGRKSHGKDILFYVQRIIKVKKRKFIFYIALFCYSILWKIDKKIDIIKGVESMNHTTVEMTITKKLTINAMCIALTFVATAFINIRLPIMANGGLVHLGNVPLFLSAILFGKKTGAVAGAFGMGLFDLLSGWTAWAPFTFIIVGIMGYVVGSIAEKKTTLWYSVAVLAALLIKIIGYYIAEVILYQNWATPLMSIPGNIIQVVVAGVIVVPTAVALRKTLTRQIGGLEK